MIIIIIYCDFIKTDEEPVSQMKLNTCYSDSDLNWENIYSIPFLISRDTYTQWIQARF
mgnify:CR=1 FL=1